jgi:hypothetical protein
MLAQITNAITNPTNWGAVTIAVRDFTRYTFGFTSFAVINIAKVVFAREVNIDAGSFRPLSLTLITDVILQPSKWGAVTVTVGHLTDWTTIPSLFVTSNR